MPTRRSASRRGRARWPRRRRRSRDARCSASSAFPPGTEREVLKGRRARLPAYVDSAYFLLYNRTLQGILEARGRGHRRPAARECAARTAASIARRSAKLAGRGPEPAAVQSDRRLCQLYRAGRLHADPAADAADGRRRRWAAPPSSRAARARAGAAAAAVLGQGLAHLAARAAGLRCCSSSSCRASTASPPPTRLAICSCSPIPFILSVSFLGQFVGTWFKRRETAVLLFIATQPAAVLPGRRRLAARGDPAAAAGGEPRLPEHLGDRRPGAHQPDGRDARRRVQRLDAAVDPRRRSTGAARPCWRRGSSSRGGPPMRRATVSAGHSSALPAPPCWRSWQSSSCAPGTRRAPPIAGMVRQTEIRIAPEITGRLAAIAVRAGQAVRKGDAAGAARQSRARRRRSARPRRRRPARAPSATASMPACATRKSRSPREASRRPRPTCCWPSSRMRAPPRWRRGTSPASQQLDESNASLAKARADLDLKRAQLAAAHGRADRRGARARRRPGGARRGDGRRPAGEARQDQADGAGRRHGRRPGRRTGRDRARRQAGADPGGRQREPWFAFTLREDALGGLTVGIDRHADDRRRQADSRRVSRSCGRSASSRPGVPRAPSATMISTAFA